MGYNWNLPEIFVGNIGSAMPSAKRGEKRLDPSPSKKGYISGSQAMMKYEIRVPVGNTSKYEETVIVLEPMTAFYDDPDFFRQSTLFREHRERGYGIVKKFFDAANALYKKHKKKFTSDEKADIEKSINFANSYLRKVNGAIEYWKGHSSLWKIDQHFKDYAGGACSFSNEGKTVTVEGMYPKYPEITVDMICPTNEEHQDHERDQSLATQLLDSAASYTRFVERLVWPKEVKRLNENASKSTIKRVTTQKVSLRPIPVKVMLVKSVVLDLPGEGADGGPIVAGDTSTKKKKKKKSVLPLIAVAGLGVMLLARK